MISLFDCLLSVRGLRKSSSCGLFHLILNKRTAAGQVLWEEVLRWEWAGRKLGTDTWGEARKSRPGQTESRAAVRSYRLLQDALKLGGPAELSWNLGRELGSPALTLYWKKFIPSLKGVWPGMTQLFAAEGCVWKVVTVRWQRPLYRLMIQTLSTKLSKSKYSINVSSYHHLYHPPESPYPSSCQKEYIALLTEESMSSFSERFPQTTYDLLAAR